MLARFFTYKLTSDDLYDLKYKSEPPYHIVKRIFTSFFAACQRHELQGEASAKVKALNMYVALIPLLCKQFQD